jgi:formate hydrogenlyase transcriptional activator
MKSRIKTNAKKGQDFTDLSKADLASLYKELYEKDLLLSFNNDIATIKDQDDIQRLIIPKLTDLFGTEDIFICRVDQRNETLNPFLRVADKNRTQIRSYNKLLKSHFALTDEFISNIIATEDPVICDLAQFTSTTQASAYISISIQAGLSESLSTALYCGEEIIGVLTLWAEKKGSFNSSHQELVVKVAHQLSILVMNISDNEKIREREREKEILLTMGSELAAIREKEDLLPVLVQQFKKMDFYHDVSIAKVDSSNNTFSAFIVNDNPVRLTDKEYPEMRKAHHPFPDGVFETALYSKKTVLFDIEKIAKQPGAPAYIKFLYKNGTVDMAGISLRDRNKEIGALFLFSDKKISFTEHQLNLVEGVANLLGTAVANILANERISNQLEEIRRYKEQLEEENQYLQEEVSSGYTFSDIIGQGAAIQQVFQQLSQVSNANSTVLIQGETGTGKELVARAIHNASPRKDKLMVRVNCATLPYNLVESELFGHEKGSFTGATERRIGKFELANNGTLFLDEIGEMPLELQVKLLRAIQEKEIERIGGKSTISVNVRIIAATNRNLEKEVDEGKFRQDLFYRLNVFPITLPPLRNRVEDIPQLVSHFIDRYSKNAGRSIRNISGKAMKELMAYSWPGNVRELEHLIERSVLMTTGSTIRQLHLPTQNKPGPKIKAEEEVLKTHEENEREHIIRVLNKCNGKISGPAGAATVLNLRTSTLNSKIKKLGIKKNKSYT